MRIEESIENIKKDTSYNYAWIYRYDKLEIIDLKNKKKEDYLDEKLLIEMRVFNRDKEARITVSNENDKDFDVMVINRNDLNESEIIKEQQIISSNKIKNMIDYKKCKITDGKSYGRYVLEFERIIGYSDDGQAYIEDQRMIDVVYKEFTIKKED